jgi:hypothetical protein
MFGIALSLAEFALVERQPSQAYSYHAVKLLDHRVFGVVQNCRRAPADIVFERQSDAARIYQEATVMLSRQPSTNLGGSRASSPSRRWCR